MTESQYHFDDSIHLEFTSAFFTGVYSMWNIYIFALIILYAPSHKQWPSASNNGANSTNDSATGRLCSNKINNSKSSELFTFSLHRKHRWGGNRIQQFAIRYKPKRNIFVDIICPQSSPRLRLPDVSREEIFLAISEQRQKTPKEI